MVLKVESLAELRVSPNFLGVLDLVDVGFLSIEHVFGCENFREDQ